MRSNFYVIRGPFCTQRCASKRGRNFQFDPSAQTLLVKKFGTRIYHDWILKNIQLVERKMTARTMMLDCAKEKKFKHFRIIKSVVS